MSQFMFMPVEVPENVTIETSGTIGLPDQTMLLKFQISGTSFSKKVESDSIVDSDQGVDTSLLSTTTKLIDKKYLEKITKADSEMRRKLNAYGLPSAFASPGMALIPNTLVATAIRAIENFKARRQEMVDELIDKWDLAVEEVRLRNPALFDPRDYPDKDKVRSRFSVTYKLMSVSLPDRLRDIDPELHNKLAAEQREAIQRDAEDIKLALRAGFANLVMNLKSKIDRIGTKETTRFTPGFVDAMSDFISTFEAKNLANDGEMADLIVQARNALNGVSVEDLRNNYEIKTSVQSTLDSIAERVGEWAVTDAGTVRL